jgi:sortase A
MLVGAARSERARARKRARARVLGEEAHGGGRRERLCRNRAGKAMRDRVLLALSIGLVVGGCLLACAPWFVDILTRFTTPAESASTVVGTYPSSDDEMRLVEQARMYNAKLAGLNPGGTVAPYDQQLSRAGTSVIATVKFPRFGTSVPVGRGTTDETLSLEAGHLEGSSLPVGGETTHCIICGHSGMFGRQLFDCLHRIGEGDAFEVDSAAGRMAYQVVSVEALTPEEADMRLSVEPGRDLTTLVTCTPYGVNDHRLLVKGERCDISEVERAESEASPFDRANGRLVPACVLAMGAVISMAAVRLRFRRNGRAGGCGVRRRKGKKRRHIRSTIR